MSRATVMIMLRRILILPMIAGLTASVLWVAFETSGRSQKDFQSREQRIAEQMNRIALATGPQERQRLMREHWQSMHQNKRMMRGMGWMWDGYVMGPGMMSSRSVSDAKPFPASSSQGAKLVTTFCVQCHAPPQPALHTAYEWASVIQRMQAYIDSGIPGIKTPTEQEMKTILEYMQENAQ